MKIQANMALPVKTSSGKVVKLKASLEPTEYKDIDHKDQLVADQLFIYRKHGRVNFDELLPQDLKNVGEPEKPVRKRRGPKPKKNKDKS